MSVERLLELGGDGAARAFLDLHLGYTESAGRLDLRESIAAGYEGLSGENVVVAAPQECIFLAMHAHLSAGDRVVVQWPAYQSLYELPRAIGCEVVRWRVRGSPEARGTKEPGWRVETEELASLLGPPTRMVVVNSPHNPTGLVIPADQRRELADLLRSRGVLLFSDEMYRGLEYDSGAPRSSMLVDYENTIVLGGLSKTHGLPGLRVGWLAADSPGLLAGPASLKDYTTICSSAPSEFLARIAVRHGPEIVGGNLRLVQRNVDLSRRFFAEHADTLVYRAGAGGSVLLPRFAGEVDASEVAAALMREHGLLLVPGTLFGMEPASFRLGLGRRELAAALEVFTDSLESLA
jgi:aspartate/methionine/tyrosine aminotransferase